MLGVTNSWNNIPQQNSHTVFLLTDSLDNRAENRFFSYSVSSANDVSVGYNRKRDNRNSIYFNGSGHITLTDDIEVTSGTKDWTIETWYYTTIATSTQSYQVMFHTRNSSSTANQYGLTCFATVGTQGPQICLSTNTSSWNIKPSSTVAKVSANTWHHLAYERSGERFLTFVNGQKVASFSSSASVLATPPRQWIGYYNNGTTYRMTGYLQDYRISDIARYPEEGFTPPARFS